MLCHEASLKIHKPKNEPPFAYLKFRGSNEWNWLIVEPYKEGFIESLEKQVWKWLEKNHASNRVP